MIQSSIGFTRKEVVAENGVVAGGHDLVAQVGVKIMQQGGNAIDAGVAAAFVAQLAEPGMCGGWRQRYHLRATVRIKAKRLSSMTPQCHRRQQRRICLNSYRGRAVSTAGKTCGTTPTSLGTSLWRYRGLWRGYVVVLARYGTMEIRDLLTPAIELAENGVEVDTRVTVTVARAMKHFRRFPLLGALYLVDGLPPAPGTFWAPGDKLTYPELADTYRAIAADGADAFYKGRIAEAIAAEIARGGGILTYDDLANYRSETRELQEDHFGEYRGLRYTPGDSNFLTQALNILENFDPCPFRSR